MDRLGAPLIAGLHLWSAGDIASDATTAARYGFYAIAAFDAFVLAIITMLMLTRRQRGDDPRAGAHPADIRWRAIIANASDGMISCDRNGKIETANATAETMFGYAQGELVGRSLGELISPEQAHDGDEEMVLSGSRKDGSSFPLQFSLSAVKVDGEPVFVIRARDITLRKRVRRTRASAEAEREGSGLSAAIAIDAGAVDGKDDQARRTKFFSGRE